MKKTLLILSLWTSYTFAQVSAELKLLKTQLPDWTANKIFLIKNGQWVALLLLILIGIMAKGLARFIAEKLVTQRLLKLLNISFTSTEQRKFSKPLGNVVFFLIWIFAIAHFEFKEKTMAIFLRIGYIFLAFYATGFLNRIVEVITLYFSTKAERTENKFDDILVPLLARAGQVLVFSIGLLIIAYAFGIDISGILAGLGIGGLAFALAAKDTLSNLFGSVMIILDKPFNIGDHISLPSGVEGSVEQVGFRSTRIRTFNDSLISIPNSELTNVSIENHAKRSARRLRTFIGIQYDTPPEKIEAFCEGIRQIILKHPYTRKDSFHVYFNGFNNSSLDILLQVYWQTKEFAVECAERHRLLMDILRLGAKMGIEFAFPTQTVHMFQEEKKAYVNELLERDPKEYYLSGKKVAQEILAKPYSAKNHRSGITSGNDFPDTEIGIK